MTVLCVKEWEPTARRGPRRPNRRATIIASGGVTEATPVTIDGCTAEETAIDITSKLIERSLCVGRDSTLCCAPVGQTPLIEFAHSGWI